MANKKVPYRVFVNKHHFLKVINESGNSIRRLGQVEEIGYTEKTIRRQLNDSSMTPWLLQAIADYIGVDPDYLSGGEEK